jgi:GNAT superfamily N-acetyltransferase
VPDSAGSEPAIEIEVVQPERTLAFRRESEREALSTQWGFPVVWHSQQHELAATEDGRVVGVLGLRIAASLAHIDSLFVDPAHRKAGVGARLVERAEELANYYNCHKVTVEVPAAGVARPFFEAIGYKLEATLPQHTFKLDVAVLRKFLL